MQKHNRQVVRNNTMNLYPEQKKFHAGFQVNSHRQIIFKILKPKTTKGSKGVCCFCLEPAHKALSLDFLLPFFPSLYFMISLHSVSLSFLLQIFHREGSYKTKNARFKSNSRVP